MHVSGQPNEFLESSQLRCANPRECTSSPATPNIRSVFLFVYLKEGGIAGISERTSYDSFTKQLIFVEGMGDVEQAQIMGITQGTEDSLKNLIRNNNLQRTQSNYPQAPGSVDYFTYTLIVVLDGKIHAVTWTDTSPIAPEGLFELAQSIESLRSAADEPAT